MANYLTHLKIIIRSGNETTSQKVISCDIKIMLGPNAVYYLTWLKQLVVVMIQETEGLFFEYFSPRFPLLLWQVIKLARANHAYINHEGNPLLSVKTKPVAKTLPIDITAAPPAVEYKNPARCLRLTHKNWKSYKIQVTGLATGSTIGGKRGKKIGVGENKIGEESEPRGSLGSGKGGRHFPLHSRPRLGSLRSPIFFLFNPDFCPGLASLNDIREFTQRRRRRLRKRHLKSEFALPQTWSRLFHLV